MCRGLTIFSLSIFILSQTCLTNVHITFFQASNDCDLEDVAYESFTQAFILYEEEVSVSGLNFIHL